MIDNQNYPWYMQKSPGFVALYNGLYEVAKHVSPLGLGDMFNVDELPAGEPLYQLGRMWGINGSPNYFDGLIYDIDYWSETKVWSGSVSTLEDKLYRNFLRMKMFIQNKRYSLITLKEALTILLGGEEATITVEESEMSFVINIRANVNVIRILQTIHSFDLHFMGQPCGIRYQFNYELA